MQFHTLVDFFVSFRKVGRKIAARKECPTLKCVVSPACGTGFAKVLLAFCVVL
jgi:hypothetical protein